jgi:1,4-alpha-glucan branching enzyme
MGGEFGQLQEWHHERTLDWHLWARPQHAGVARWIADLNAAYRRLPALHVNDFHAKGFEWLPVDTAEPQTVLAYVRRGGPDDALAVALVNMTPEPRIALRLALPHAGTWHELLNSDSVAYGGSGMGNLGRVVADDTPLAGWPASATLTLPPLATLVLVDQAIDMSVSPPGGVPR